MSFLAQNSELTIHILSILQQIKASLIPVQPSHPLLAFIIAEYDILVYCFYVKIIYNNSDYHNYNYKYKYNYS